MPPPSNKQPAAAGRSAPSPLPPRRGRVAGGITLLEVARLAGVSAMSVSRALNAPEQVSAAILAKVRAAVESTGYVANRVAGSLASQRSRLVAAVVPSIAGPVFQEMVQSLIAELAARDHQLMLGQSGYGTQEEDALLDAIIGRRPDGIVLGGVVPSAAGRRRLVASGIPVVETWDMVQDPIDMLVGFSHEAIATAVATFLIERGRRRLGFIGGNHERAARRAGAFVDSALRGPARRRAVAVQVETVVAPATVRSGRQALGEMLRHQPGTDAIFCSSDVLALGVVTEAAARGLRVPQDLAVVGFGDLDFAADVSPSLTTVRIDSTRIGQLAARFIVSRSEGLEVGETKVDVGFSIVTRESA
ncbi:LacI family DNA-binding transcriptional regulator [Variovorax sp. VRV01]|uniref:LacI family DNA-binding transcriptional regulator n=1 Tax=Variovorax sp. VRV01 TaxID=2769259 RepID=UPI001782B6A6|nr:LacI family DNA-binding transcriptional regulator [Variovorax sp. VRV01]MBD9667305.1 LacI family DNA-binding transcriptional regulator [Variovorax sp. VRV01]